MVDTSQTQMHTTIGTTPPVPDASLVAWAVVAEWELPDGEKLLTRIASPGTPIWGFKGYMHEGLYGIWASPDLRRWAGNGE
jgi:hypothetical protein